MVTMITIKSQGNVDQPEFISNFEPSSMCCALGATGSFSADLPNYRNP